MATTSFAPWTSSALPAAHPIMGRTVTGLKEQDSFLSCYRCGRRGLAAPDSKVL